MIEIDWKRWCIVDIFSMAIGVNIGVVLACAILSNFKWHKFMEFFGEIVNKLEKGSDI